MHLHDQFLANSRKFGSVLGLFHYMVPIAICLFVLLTCSTLFVFTRKGECNQVNKALMNNPKILSPIVSSTIPYAAVI